MVLSNAERQRRYRERLKAAARGVTPEMVVEAIRHNFEEAAADDPSLGSWDDYVASCNTKRGRGNWLSNLWGLTPEVFDGEGEEQLRNVAAVIQAVVNPPKAG